MADKMMWAYLIHLGMNMWQDKDTVFPPNHIPSIGDPRYSEKLRCDRKTWTDVIDHLPQAGIDTVVIDIGEGIRYESHPELAVEGSWSAAELKRELDRMRSLGLTPIPKLNFSACHDAWLGEYSHMLSTQTYYGVCGELIDEVCELFGHPAYFHLGMDEENYDNQREYGYIVIRGEKLWWHDLYFLFDRCEKNGARPWIWADYYWYKQELFKERMPKSALLSNWQYGRAQGKDPATGRYPQIGYQTYVDFNALGYDQVLTSSTWSHIGNSDQTVRLAKEEDFDPEHLKGFMTAPWQATESSNRLRLMEDADRLGEARRKYFGDRPLS